eukprot:12904928-Prorocentrum_lima.AAC.1
MLLLRREEVQAPGQRVHQCPSQQEKIGQQSGMGTNNEVNYSTHNRLFTWDGTNKAINSMACFDVFKTNCMDRK